MRLHDLKPAPGSRRPRKRVGRGDAAGQGSYAGKGIKGQKVRTGDNIPPHFRGMSFRANRAPKYRGWDFRGPVYPIEYAEVNVRALNRFEPNTVVTPELLRQVGLVKSDLPVKVLGDGTLDRPLVVQAHRFSAAARAKIEAAGGRAEELGLNRKREQAGS